MEKTTLDRLIEQLDSLIPFIATSYENVFRLLNREKAIMFSFDESKLPIEYEVYRKQINHAALILGYSYFENFLNDLLIEILRNRPTMLPSNKSLKYSDIIKNKSIDNLIDELIKKELIDLFYCSMSDIIKELRERYNFSISKDEKDMLCKFSLIRNCIIHNSSKADERLASYKEFEAGKEFEITSSEIHSIGIKLRALVRTMFREAEIKHFKK
jgi:hypothetical protein